MKKLIVLICLLVALPSYAADYNSTLTGAQVDSGAAIGNAIGAVTGIVKMDGAGTPSAASAGTDYLVPAAINVTLQQHDDDLDTAATATGSGNSKYFGTSAAGVVGFHSLPAADLGFTVDAPGAAGGVLISDGSKWERKTAFTGTVGGYSVSMGLVSTPSGLITSHATTTAAEVGYLTGVTSAIQTQLDTKAPKIITEVDGSAAITPLSTAQMSSTIIYNTGQAAADITITAGTAAAGYNMLFTVGTTQAANDWKFRAAANDKIYAIAENGSPTAGSDNGYFGFSTPAIGNSFACWTFKTNAYDWMCKCISGTCVTTAP